MGYDRRGSHCMAQLMFRTANEPPTDILPVGRALPSTLMAFLDYVIVEAAGPRYRTGDELAAGRVCLRRSRFASGR